MRTELCGAGISLPAYSVHASDVFSGPAEPQPHAAHCCCKAGTRTMAVSVHLCDLHRGAWSCVCRHLCPQDGRNHQVGPGLPRDPCALSHRHTLNEL